MLCLACSDICRGKTSHASSILTFCPFCRRQGVSRAASHCRTRERNPSEVARAPLGGMVFTCAARQRARPRRSVSQKIKSRPNSKGPWVIATCSYPIVVSKLRTSSRRSASVNCSTQARSGSPAAVEALIILWIVRACEAAAGIVRRRLWARLDIDCSCSRRKFPHLEHGRTCAVPIHNSVRGVTIDLTAMDGYAVSYRPSSSRFVAALYIVPDESRLGGRNIRAARSTSVLPAKSVRVEAIAIVAHAG